MDFLNSQIRQVFDQYQPHIKQALLTIRQWIFEIAENSDQIGQLEECAKLGAPSCVTHSPK